VQNKVHWAAHGHTAAEVIAARAAWRRQEAMEPQMNADERGSGAGALEA